MSNLPPVSRVLPLAGLYRLSNAGLVDPANAGMDLSAGGMQFLGVWDTRPELAPWDASLHRSLGPRPAPGGVALRWVLARTGNPASSSPPPNPGPVMSGAVALRLFVAGVDVLPTGDGWRTSNSWPGSLPDGAADEANNRAWIAALATAAGAQRGGLEWPTNTDGLRLLARYYARPVLDLLAYAGQPMCEADLGELAGGCRYVAAWLQQVWCRSEGADPIGSATLDIPWVVVPGPARAPVHRVAWHCAYPMAAPVIASANDLFSEDPALASRSARVGLASPISGVWTASARHNGLAGADPITFGLELRAGQPVARDSTEVEIDDTIATLTFANAHGGAATLCVGGVAAGAMSGALVHVSVIASCAAGGGGGVGP